MPDAVTHSFQAEVSQVLHLVIHSLYSHKEIFLRELVSNASDALDKLRFRAVTEPDLMVGDAKLIIRITPDRAAKTLTIEDNGVGMSEEELVRDLGTVARSGSRAFLEQLAAQGKKDARLIGQFGVGFYSAYLVANRVSVVSRPAGPGQKAACWVSDGKDTFTVSPDDREDRGTAVTLHLSPEHEEFLEEWRLRELITRYSDYVSHPIELRVQPKGDASPDQADDAKYETVNKASALWQRAKSEITEEQYDDFFTHLAHAGASKDDKPLARVHFKVEGTQEFAGLLYVPREPPFELRFGMKARGVRLYVKRVLVMDDCEEIVPEWLRFIVGVIDSDDLPLNVSRELLQESSAVRTIKKQIVRQVLDALDTLAKDKPDDYAVFWTGFGSFLKRGVASEFDHKDRIAKLLRFESTGAAGMVSLSDYVGRMKDGQPAIYYVIGESRKGLEGAPHLEGLRKRGYEVLLMTDPVDEWATAALSRFEGKPLVSAMRADLKIQPEESEKAARAADAETLKPLFERVRSVLGDRITDVRTSDRLTDSPCCLVLSNAGPHGYVERLLREAGRDVPRTARILEVNPDHPVVKNLRALVQSEDQEKSAPAVADWIELLYGQALVAEGAPLDDPGGFARRLTSMLTELTTATAQKPAPTPATTA